MRQVVAYLETGGLIKEADVRAWCRNNDCKLVGIYHDWAFSSGKADARSNLERALNDVCVLGDVFFVSSLSMLAHSFKDLWKTLQFLGIAKKDLVISKEKINMSGAIGKTFFGLVEILAQFERNLISERNRAIVEYKRERHERIGKIPFGYDLAEDRVKLIPNSEEQAIIRKIKDLRDTGLSYRKIADFLTNREIRTKEGNPIWTHTAVKRILARKELPVKSRR